MNFDTVTGILAVAGSLLLVVTSLLNFSVFLRQLRAGANRSRPLAACSRPRWQGPEIQMPN